MQATSLFRALLVEQIDKYSALEHEDEFKILETLKRHAAEIETLLSKQKTNRAASRKRMLDETFDLYVADLNRKRGSPSRYMNSSVELAIVDTVAVAGKR